MQTPLRYDRRICAYAHMRGVAPAYARRDVLKSRNPDFGAKSAPEIRISGQKLWVRTRQKYFGRNISPIGLQIGGSSFLREKRRVPDFQPDRGRFLAGVRPTWDFAYGLHTVCHMQAEILWFII